VYVSVSLFTFSPSNPNNSQIPLRPEFLFLEAKIALVRLVTESAQEKPVQGGKCFRWGGGAQGGGLGQLSLVQLVIRLSKRVKALQSLRGCWVDRRASGGKKHRLVEYFITDLGGHGVRSG
jgi:hypothetical protein